jgi:hypothetical protein
MGALRLAGVLWIIGGLSSAAVIFGVLHEPFQLALTVGGTIVGLTIGACLVARPGPGVVRWSSIAGIAWLVAFGALTLFEIAMRMGYVSTAVWLTAWGVAGAVVAYWRRAAAASA